MIRRCHTLKVDIRVLKRVKNDAKEEEGEGEEGEDRILFVKIALI